MRKVRSDFISDMIKKCRVCDKDTGELYVLNFIYTELSIIINRVLRCKEMKKFIIPVAINADEDPYGKVEDYSLSLIANELISCLNGLRTGAYAIMSIDSDKHVKIVIDLIVNIKAAIFEFCGRSVNVKLTSVL